MEDNKKITAAISAVLSYIKNEEEAICINASMNRSALDKKLTQSSCIVNQWGISGRQTMMAMQNMMQMKSFHTTKLR